MLALNQKKVFKCKICSRSCAYHFYGVKACEGQFLIINKFKIKFAFQGCKQFFRRVVIKQQKYFCCKEQKCKIGFFDEFNIFEGNI